ncbi:MAG: VWA domain-containing protein [Candidatus Geothermincolales bacterium]
MAENGIEGAKATEGLKIRVLDFARALRARGIDVSPSEELDSLRALALADWSDRAEVKAALMCTLLKDPDHREDFEELFREYFEGRPLQAEKARARKEIAWEQALESFSSMHGGMNALVFGTLSGSHGWLAEIAREALEGIDTGGLLSGLQTGMYARRAFNSLDWEKADGILSQFVEWLRELGWPEDERDAVLRRYQEGKDLLFEEIRYLVERERRRNLDEYMRRGAEERLMDKPIGTLDEVELQQARRIALMLAGKLRSKMKMRMKTAGKGRLDAKKTLRKNMGCDCVPFQVMRRRKRIEKPDIFVLCDVSSSVARVSQFMLQFVHTLQDCVQRVRSFVFVDSLGEVTDFFREQDVEEGVRSALTRAGIRYHSRSDFGAVFRQFCREYLSDVGYRSFIIVIGDARCNYNDPCAWALERMAERCRGIVWLNPETRSFWDTGDSVMGAYAPYCKEVKECRTLRQLEEAVASLLPMGGMI